MKFITSLIVLSSMFINTALAGCEKSVTLLDKDAPAPCKGYLFSPEQELKVRTIVDDYPLLQQDVDNKAKKIKFLNQDINDSDSIANKEREKSELWRVRAEDSTKKLIESEQGRGTRDMLFMGLGILLTIGAGFAIGAAAKR